MVDGDGRGIDYLVISLKQRQEQIFLKGKDHKVREECGFCQFKDNSVLQSRWSKKRRGKRGVSYRF